MPDNLSLRRRVGQGSRRGAVSTLFLQRLSGRQSIERGGAVLRPTLYIALIAERRAEYEDRCSCCQATRVANVCK